MLRLRFSESDPKQSLDRNAALRRAPDCCSLIRYAVGLTRGHKKPPAMTLARRKFLSLSAAAVALPAVHRAAWAQTPPAERLAAYADRLRFADIDAATIEQVRSFVIDTIGCGIAAFDEKAVLICRDVALASGQGTSEGTSTVIGTGRRIAPD